MTWAALVRNRWQEMISLPRALTLSLGQLGDPAIVKVLVKSIAVTILIFLATGSVILTALYRALVAYGVGLSAEISAVAAVLLTVVAGWLLFRFVALFVLQFFADEIVRAVEARHYPHAAAVANLPFRQELAGSLRSTMRALLVNLAALPFALILLVTGVGTAILFWAVNGWLLGRELQDMVWLRHRGHAQEIAPITPAQRFLLGGTVAAILLVPFANLLAPVIGAASATHMVHRGRQTDA